MYNNFIVLHGYQHDEAFLRHEFVPVMLDALGLNDASGVIYEILVPIQLISNLAESFR
jgi:hypothetical protein